MDELISANLNWGLICLTYTGAGILGNSSLFCLYNFSLLTMQVLRPIDLILSQLVLANNLVLFSKGIPQTMAAFGLKSFLDNIGCKFVFYLHRVARGVSLSTTCLLSGFQAIKLCPSISQGMELRFRFPKYIGFCCFLCWIFQLLLNIFIVMNVTHPRNSKNMSTEKTYRYCYSPIPETLLFSLHAVIFSFTDAMCLGLMVWTSGSMVFVLHKHKRRLQHIHSRRLSSKLSHEARATRTILILVSMFISFYCISSVLSFWITQTVNPSQWLLNFSILVSSGFPTFSSFVFLFSDIRVSRFCFACWTRKTNAPATVSGL